MTTDMSVKHRNKMNKCLFYKIISYPDTAEKEQEDSIFSNSYEAANLCDYKLNVTLVVSLDNMKSTHDKSIWELLPYSVTYIASMIRTVPYWPSKVDLNKLFVATYLSPPPDIP